MLGQLADYARIVSPTPNDAFITSRRSAVSDLISENALSLDLRVALVELSAFGIPSVRGPAHVEAIDALVAAVQAHQPSFPNDVEATQMDLRLIATVVLGETLRTSPTDIESQYLAALLRSATHLHPLPAEAHLAKLVNDVITVAGRSLEAASKKLRVRDQLDDVTIQGAEAPAVAKSATTSVNGLVRTLRDNLRADREELEVLWWVFGSRSTRTGKRFDSLPPGECALVAATELSERMLVPPIAAASHLLGSLVRDDGELSTTQFVSQLSREALRAYLHQRGHVASVLNAHASLLPFTWLSARLVDSDHSPGWEHEFAKKTRLEVETTFSPMTWAQQLFDELVAHRLRAAVEEQAGDTE